MLPARTRARRFAGWLLAALVAAPGTLTSQVPASPAALRPGAAACVSAETAPAPPFASITAAREGDAASRCGALAHLPLRTGGRATLPGLSGAGSPDVAIARALRATDLQENGTARAVAGVFRLASLPGTLLVAGALYGIGELQDRPDLSDLGVHTGQAIVGAGAVTLAGKITAGRARPHLSPEDASDFAFGRGLRGDDYQAFPSAHTAAAFAAGTVIALDVADRHPDAAAWAYPSIYAAAAMAGLSRLFDEEHWATDILAGALIGITAGLVVDEWQGGRDVP